MPWPTYVSWIWRGAGVWRGNAFFFLDLELLGTPAIGSASADDCDITELTDGIGASLRRELKEDINSTLWGESPSRLLK